MKHSLSYNFYLKILQRYIIAPILVDLFMLVLVFIEPSLWPYYLIISISVVIVFLPLITIMLKRLKKAKTAEGWQMYEGRILKLEPEMSFTFKSYLKAYVEIHDEGKFMVETYPVLEPKLYDKLKNKEVQIAYKKGKKAFIMMIL